MLLLSKQQRGRCCGVAELLATVGQPALALQQLQLPALVLLLLVSSVLLLILRVNGAGKHMRMPITSALSMLMWCLLASGQCTAPQYPPRMRGRTQAAGTELNQRHLRF
jgi:hypothetical protein